MNKNIREIIELSDCEWIQKRKPPKTLPLYLFDYYGIKSFDFNIYLIKNVIEKSYLWLPVGFNPESGNWQIDELLMEAMGFIKPTICVLRDMFIEWLKGNETTESTIILKLEWLYELIENGSCVSNFDYAKFLEIVGNIYENPELLEERNGKKKSK